MDNRTKYKMPLKALPYANIPSPIIIFKLSYDRPNIQMSALLDLLHENIGIVRWKCRLIEDIYERYSLDPASIDPAWRKQFERMLQSSANEARTSHMAR